MSEKYIEKAFLYFVAFSLLLHVAVLTVLYFLPEEKREFAPEPYMVELSDLPEVKDKSQSKEHTKRLDEVRRRVAREIAPKGAVSRERLPSATASVPRRPAVAAPLVENVPQLPHETARGPKAVSPDLKKFPELAKLFPSAERMSRLEESYRKKYDAEIEEGETSFLNSDDIQFGSFLRRFETAVYGVWTYPAAASRAGIQGVTPVKITFNRKGEIENIQLLQSSGSRILDDEVFRALRALGPIGSFPKNYTKDHFNLIAFFEYGLSSGLSRGSIR
ncbi:MAG: energy transducer TonB [Deltaproteobacteria bacterium]|nr:energy transducer TonB [Deltaproteobacteria bacterium]TLN03539.1 MAG: energy transducer TonB [bacterium]